MNFGNYIWKVEVTFAVLWKIITIFDLLITAIWNALF